MDNKTVNTKSVRRRRSDCAWKKSSMNHTSLKHLDSDKHEMIEYPAGPIQIHSSWNPVNRADKPPYSYATIIGHAILTSKERKLTLNDIYVWITENYPFYSNDTQGWQNSIRHNLSLHKAFVKIERDSNSQNPPRKGCFWTIRAGKEKSFIDNLQKPVNSVRKQQSLSHLVSSATLTRRQQQQQQQQQRRSSSATNSTNPTVTTATTSTTGSTIAENSSNGLFNTFRATVIPSQVTTHLVPESEAIVVTSSSSSSDHNQSPITSNTSSPIYNQLMMPESNTTYNVYPDESQHTELFGDDLNSYSYSITSGTSYLTDPPHQQPSLSPCDAYSTTSSFYADPFAYSKRSQDYTYHSRNYTSNYKSYPNNMMDLSNHHHHQQQAPTTLKHDTILYNSNSTSPYYFLDSPSRLSGNHDYNNSFLHR